MMSPRRSSLLKSTADEGFGVVDAEAEGFAKAAAPMDNNNSFNASQGQQGRRRNVMVSTQRAEYTGAGASTAQMHWMITCRSDKVRKQEASDDAARRGLAITADRGGEHQASDGSVVSTCVT